MKSSPKTLLLILAAKRRRGMALICSVTAALWVIGVPLPGGGLPAVQSALPVSRSFPASARQPHQTDVRCQREYRARRLAAPQGPPPLPPPAPLSPPPHTPPPPPHTRGAPRRGHAPPAAPRPPRAPPPPPPGPPPPRGGKRPPGAEWW